MAALQQKLEKLYTLLHTGVLSEDEFNRRKEAMIDEFVGGADKAAQSTSYSSLTVAQPVVAVAPTAVVQEEYSGPLICCRLRGLPFTVTSQEVINFLEGFSIDWASGGIKLVMDPANENICTGIGYVVFTSEAEAQRAVQEKDKQNIEHRYIEVVPSTYAEMSAGQVSRRPGKTAEPAFQAQRYSPYGKGKGKGVGKGVPQWNGAGKGKGMGKGVAMQGKGAAVKGRGAWSQGYAQAGYAQAGYAQAAPAAASGYAQSWDAQSWNAW
jgi:hypothetical protein